MDNNIQEIQELYKEKRIKREEGKIEDEEVILLKLYEVSKSTPLITQSSFITDEVNNLLKYMKMKFVWASTQTRIFQLLLHYQSLKSRVLQIQALRVGQVKEPYIGLTQENSIENSVQDSLPYISWTHGPC